MKATQHGRIMSAERVDESSITEGDTPSILLAVDPAGPPPDSAAINAVALATGWPLVLVNALPYGTSTEALADANQRLAESARTFIEHGVDTRTRTLAGPPVDVIVAEAEAVRAAIIVVGGRRGNADGRPALGSVAASLLKVVDRPVLVLPVGPGPARPGFVAAVERLIHLIDRSEEADTLAELRDAAAQLRPEPSEANRNRLDRRLRDTFHQFETDHPSLTAAINDVAYYLSGMGI